MRAYLQISAVARRSTHQPIVARRKAVLFAQIPPEMHRACQSTLVRVYCVCACMHACARVCVCACACARVYAGVSLCVREPVLPLQGHDGANPIGAESQLSEAITTLERRMLQRCE